MAMVLRDMLAPARHVSVSWDRHRKCREACCSRCPTIVGVNEADRLNQHGPHGSPCPGSGGATTYPLLTIPNCRRALRDAHRAMTAMHRRTTKRR
jgi:hypothetical protein